MIVHMKNTTLALLLSLITLTSLSAFAEDEEMIVISESKKIEIELSEETTIVDPAAVTVIHTDENGEPAAYLVKKDDGSQVVIGVVDERMPLLGGILNAYVGAQTVFGVRAGVSLFNLVDFGVHASMNGTGMMRGAFYPFVTKAGTHVNIKFRPFKGGFEVFQSVEFFTGIRWNDYKKEITEPGYKRTKWKGKTTELLGGMNFYLDEHQSLGFEAGVAKGLLNKYKFYGDEVLEANIKHKAPIFNLTYTFTIFENR